MLKRLNEIRKTEGGFTLVEMLVVVSILGVLASVAVVAIGGTMSESKVAACKSDVATVQTATDTHYAKVGKYPTEVADLADELRTIPSSEDYEFAFSTDGKVTAVTDPVGGCETLD